MIKPDVILTWGRHVDFPLCRYNLKRFAPYFNKVYIALTDHGMEADYTQFFTTNIDAQFKNLPLPTGSQDWRNVAVNTMLEKSEATHVLFLEQDFLIKDDRFFEVLLNQSEYDFIYYDEQERVHPACALLPRHIIDQTSKDFSARPPAYDHFGLFFQEAIRLTNSADLETIGLHKGEDYYHLAGLTQNYHAKPFHKPNEFLTYNRYAMRLPSIVYPNFYMVMEEIDKTNPFLVSDTVLNMIPNEAKETQDNG